MPRFDLFWPGAVRQLLRQQRHFVRQTGRSDCGVASALTVLNMLGRPADPVQAVEAMDADRAGTDLDTLRRYFAESQGFDAQALSVPAGRIGRVPGRVILHMRQLHYVVLLRASGRGVLVFDPAMGPVFYPAADFASLYSGHLLAISRSASDKRLPALPARAGIARAAEARGIEPAALFVTGAAMRLLECALLLCVVAVLFLVLNHASFPSLLMAFGLIALCGGLLLLARRARGEGEADWIARRQSRLWRGLVRISMRGRDINGFRGRHEADVAASLRHGLTVLLPQRAQIPAALGAFATMPVLLWLLHPLLALLHLALLLAALALVQLQGVQVCRRSVQKGTGRYAPLRQGNAVLGAFGGPEVLGEVAKWTVIGFAGFGVLLSSLPPVALMFWILTAMQIVPLDFRKVAALAPALGAHAPVSALTGSEVPLRRQRVIGTADLTLSQSPGLLRVEGIAPLTMTLQQPDLTVREQRLIMADVVRAALESLPEEARPRLGPVRIFGPGQDASPADFEYLMIAREAGANSTLPVKQPVRRTLDESLSDPVLRNLHSCAPGDFPVFWDYRDTLAVTDLQARLRQTGLRRAGHLTMSRLTVVEAA